MNAITLQHAREHYRQLPPHKLETATAKHYLALLKLAERLYRENNRLEIEARALRTFGCITKTGP